MRKYLGTGFKWIVTLAALAGMLAGLYLLRTRTDEGKETAEEKPQAKVVAGRIKVGAALAKERIKVEPAIEVEWVPRTTVYGRVVPHPSASGEIRAPFAGRLIGTHWPALGSRVKAGEGIGQLEVRIGPTERLDLEAKLSEARLKEQGARKVVQIQSDRLKRLESAGPMVVRGELDAAVLAVAEAESQAAIAAGAVTLWQNTLSALNATKEGKERPWQVPLTSPIEGEVSELLGRPGVMVEPGAVIAKIADYRQALVRLDVPLSMANAGVPKTLEFFDLPSASRSMEGPTNQPDPPKPVQGVAGEQVGMAPQVDPNLQMVSYLYEIKVETEKDSKGPAAFWRPGLFVKARLKASEAKAVSAVGAPDDSLLYHQGRALLYVQLSPGVYRRVEVQVLGREAGRWAVTGDVDEGDLVVTEGAILLLSEEFRTEVDED